MNTTTNITLAGVGGQGIILTSEILARAAALCGFDVKKSEIHGMSQRGGSVSSQVRFGAKVMSPVIADGGSDIVVAFERLEAARAFPLLKKGGRALINNLDITPLGVSIGAQPGVADIAAMLESLYGASALYVDAPGIADEAGSARAANLAVAGALSTLLPFPEDAWAEALKSRVSAATLDVNLKAFRLSRARVAR